MTVALYAFSILMSASLLFLVQPMFARFVLPVLGGAPNVWNTALVFYQAVLLAGYAYAHFSTRGLGAHKQAKLHIGLMALPLLVLPIAVRSLGDPPTATSPVLWLLLTLALSVGLPFFVVSAGAPLIQRWYSQLNVKDAGDPYFLYGASNVGSMLGLIAYPLFIEPTLTLRTQTVLWAVGYVVMFAAFIASAVVMLRSPVREEPPESADEPRPDLRRRARWVLLAFVPVALMMGVTTFLSTDIASIPLMWAFPLALYLLTFIFAFARRSWIPVRALGWVLPALLLFALLGLVGPIIRPPWLVASLGLAGFFFSALVCHGLLAQDRPPPRYLTEFFMLISFGGVLGGLFCGLLAPVLFDKILEYAVAIVVCLALCPAVLRREPGRWTRPLDLAAPLIGGGVTYLGIEVHARLAAVPGGGPLGFGFTPPWVALVPGALVCLLFMLRPLRTALAATGLAVVAVWFGGIGAGLLYETRGFFGSVRVVDSPDGLQRWFYHGTTMHGSQMRDPVRAKSPIAYYHPEGPMGDVFNLRGLPSGARVGVVGLGVGAVAAYSRPDQDWTFYEIDPDVARVAADPALFTYLRDMAAPHRVVLGDARMQMARTDRQYDLIVLAAYSSATVPVHLLTREAFAVYKARLRPGGLIAMHIGNRFLRLEPVTAAIAEDAGLVGIVRADAPPDVFAVRRGRVVSEWVAFARSDADLGALPRAPGWRPLAGDPNVPVWTDDYSSIVSVLMALDRFR